jgi:probable HAF family extracellular repeat protein
LTGGTYTTLNPPGSVSTIAEDINNKGQIVGSYYTSGSNYLTHGFIRLSDGSYLTYDDPYAGTSTLHNGTEITGVNDALALVGGYYDGLNHRHGYFIQGLLHITLDDPFAGPGGTQAGGINNQGQIVGEYTDAAGHNHGFLYNSGTYITLDHPLGANGTYATGINDVGQIVGTYVDASHHEHGFLLTLAPNPPPPAGTTADMILRASNSSTSAGLYEVYDIGSNSLLAAYELGQVGTDWQFVGLGGFFGSDTSDLLLRNSKTGGLEVYDINNNQITGAAFLGTVGLEWQYAGIAPVHAAGASDLVLRNVNTGAFEVYNNQLTGASSLGQVGLDWQLGGFAADPPTAPGTFADLSSDQLAQAMAGFGDDTGAADGLDTALLGAAASAETFLTTPQ